MTLNDIDENYVTGYVKLFRSLRNHWLWQDPEKLRWWLDLLLEVNHTYKNVNLKFDIVPCERGQSVHSMLWWSNRWVVDKSTAYRFFKLLEKDGMIKMENLKKTTRITICNYASYNYRRNEIETSLKRDRNAIETPRNTNNNEKNEKKERRGIGSPSVSDVVSYFLENGYSEQSAKKAHEYYELANWHDSKGNKVKNWKQKMIAVWFKPENKQQTNGATNGYHVPTIQDALKQRGQ